MKAKLFLTLAVLSVVCCSALAKSPNPKAEIKVGYNYHHVSLRNDGEAIINDHNYTLLTGRGYSKYYNYGNEYIDSLESTPSGRALHNKLISIGVQQYLKKGDDSAIPHYKGRIYVFKSLPERTTTVYDAY